MMFLRRLFPDIHRKNIYDIDYRELYKRGFRGILFDIDNTLTTHGTVADEGNIEFFEKLRNMGFKTCLMSNNKEERVMPFAKAVGSPYIFKANKPSKSGYLSALKLLNLKEEETVFIGDQIFTDILGANNAGIYSILLDPISPREEIQIVIKRFFEKIVLFFYNRRAKR